MTRLRSCNLSLVVVIVVVGIISDVVTCNLLDDLHHLSTLKARRGPPVFFKATAPETDNAGLVGFLGEKGYQEAHYKPTAHKIDSPRPTDCSQCRTELCRMYCGTPGGRKRAISDSQIYDQKVLERTNSFIDSLFDHLSVERKQNIVRAIIRNLRRSERNENDFGPSDENQ